MVARSEFTNFTRLRNVLEEIIFESLDFQAGSVRVDVKSAARSLGELVERPATGLATVTTAEAVFVLVALV